MEHIALNLLHPGETALSGPRVSELRDLLASGAGVEPVPVSSIEGRLVVRDGNNRVRALIEHDGGFQQDLPIPCIRVDPPPSDSARYDGLRCIAEHYGNGRSAFLAMPLSDENDYESLQARMHRKILRTFPGI